MKLLLSVLAAASLSGCVAYGVPYGAASVQYTTESPYYGGAYYGSPYVVQPGPVYIQGAPARGYGHAHPRVHRDRDGDGVSNRYDRDRDGDGVRNRRDAHPNDPRRH